MSPSVVLRIEDRGLLNPTAAQLATLRQVLAEFLDSANLLTTPQATEAKI